MTLTLRPGYVPKTALVTAISTAKTLRQVINIMKDSKILATIEPTGEVEFHDQDFQKACT